MYESREQFEEAVNEFAETHNLDVDESIICEIVENDYNCPCRVSPVLCPCECLKVVERTGTCTCGLFILT